MDNTSLTLRYRIHKADLLHSYIWPTLRNVFRLCYRLAFGWRFTELCWYPCIEKNLFLEEPCYTYHNIIFLHYDFFGLGLRKYIFLQVLIFPSETCSDFLCNMFMNRKVTFSEHKSETKWEHSRPLSPWM